MAPRKRTGQRNQRMRVYARRLRELREQWGLTQTQLAQRAGLKDGSAISQLETGERQPSLDTALALSAVFHLTVEEMCGGPPQGTTIHHHHTPGEVRMWVSNPGVVVLGNYSPQDIERLLESWGRMRDVVQGEDPSPVVFPDEAEA